MRLQKNNPPIINNPLNETIHFSIPFKDDRKHIFLVYIDPRSNIEDTIFPKAVLYKKEANKHLYTKHKVCAAHNTGHFSKRAWERQYTEYISADRKS